MNAVFGFRRTTVALVLLALLVTAALALLVAGAFDLGHGTVLAGNGVIHTSD